MKKLFAIVIAASMFSGLYGFSIGIGGRYDNLFGPEDTDAYLGIRADVMCKPMPILGLRMGLVQVDLKEDATFMFFGTGVNADVLVYIPMMGMVNPYLVLGAWYKMDEADPSLGDYSLLILHAGIGGEFGFGGFAGYLEAAFNMQSFSPDVGDSQTDNWFYVQVGVRIPIGM
jgi:hypothetical protein